MGTSNQDIVFFALARSMKPTDEEVPVRAFDNAGAVVVPVL